MYILEILYVGFKNQILSIQSVPDLFNKCNIFCCIHLAHCSPFLINTVILRYNHNTLRYFFVLFLELKILNYKLLHIVTILFQQYYNSKKQLTLFFLITKYYCSIYDKSQKIIITIKFQNYIEKKLSNVSSHRHI